MLCLALIFFGWTNLALAGAGNACGQRIGFEAEDSISKLKDWDSVFNSFKQYADCDDGALAEGYTESVVHLLASKWSTLQRASILSTRDPAFREFILRHINASADTDELRQIKNLSHNKCAKHLSGFCGSIESAATKAVSDLEEYLSNKKLEDSRTKY
jgi:hypothetical protein